MITSIGYLDMLLSYRLFRQTFVIKKSLHSIKVGCMFISTEAVRLLWSYMRSFLQLLPWKSLPLSHLVCMH